MISVSQVFAKKCTEKYRALGFSRNKSVFVRMKGDVIHSFTIKKFCSAPCCTVEFGVFPLCNSAKIYLDAGGYDLSELTVEGQEWSFIPQSQDSIEQCIESVLQAMDQFMIPFFDKCQDCKTSLANLQLLEQEIEMNRLAILKARGVADRAIPFAERIMFDRRKFDMALKAQDMAYARYYLEFNLQHESECLKRFRTEDPPTQPECVITGITESVAHYENQLKRLEAGDFLYFDKLVTSNEARNREWLSEMYPRIFREAN